jgi:hypothetical protein
VAAATVATYADAAVEAAVWGPAGCPDAAQPPPEQSAAVAAAAADYPLPCEPARPAALFRCLNRVAAALPRLFPRTPDAFSAVPPQSALALGLRRDAVSGAPLLSQLDLWCRAVYLPVGARENALGGAADAGGGDEMAALMRLLGGEGEDDDALGEFRALMEADGAGGDALGALMRGNPSL